LLGACSPSLSLQPSSPYLTPLLARPAPAHALMCPPGNKSNATTLDTRQLNNIVTATSRNSPCRSGVWICPATSSRCPPPAATWSLCTAWRPTRSRQGRWEEARGAEAGPSARRPGTAAAAAAGRGARGAAAGAADALPLMHLHRPSSPCCWVGSCLMCGAPLLLPAPLPLDGVLPAPSHTATLTRCHPHTLPAPPPPPPGRGGNHGGHGALPAPLRLPGLPAGQGLPLCGTRVHGWGLLLLLGGFMGGCYAVPRIGRPCPTACPSVTLPPSNSLVADGLTTPPPPPFLPSPPTHPPTSQNGCAPTHLQSTCACPSRRRAYWMKLPTRSHTVGALGVCGQGRRGA
jgi:hypothetical protein